MLLAVLVAFPASGQTSPSSREGIRDLVGDVRGASPGAEPWLGRLRDGSLEFFRAPDGGYVYIDAEQSPSRRPEQVARGFLATHGRAFGIASPHTGFTLKRIRQSCGRDQIRLRQTYHGLDVFAGEIFVILDGTRRVEAVLSDIMRNTEVLDNLDVQLTPTVDLQDALANASAFMARLANEEDWRVQAEDVTAEHFKVFRVSEPMIYDPTIVGRNGSPSLVWKVTLGPRGGSCLLYTSPSPRDRTRSRMPSSA